MRMLLFTLPFIVLALALPGPGGGLQAARERTIEAITVTNERLLAAKWLTLQPGQGERSGFALAADGVLSHAGRPLKPALILEPEPGQKRAPPSSVRISPVAPAGGRFAFMVACEPVAAADNLCWFQYLLDLEQGRVHALAWAKYPTEVPVWWSEAGRFALLPVSSEGDLWLALVDLQTREIRALHFDGPLPQPPVVGGKLCPSGGEESLIELERLTWVNPLEITLPVWRHCGPSGPVRRLDAVVTLENGAIAFQPVGNPPPKAAARAGFDCRRAATPVEKMICADAGLSALNASPFPAIYVGGFTGRERLEFTGDGRVLGEGIEEGRFEVDRDGPWADARHPVRITWRVAGEVVSRHCKVEPALRRLLCHDGGTLAAEYLREGPAPAVDRPPPVRCDEEQLYLDVMEAARKARPDLDLKGSDGVRSPAPGRCRIALLYVRDGESLTLEAAYPLKNGPVTLEIIE